MSQLDQIFPEEVLKDRLLEMFPADYWEKWERKFGHHFLSAHMARTYEYDLNFIVPEFTNHSVLEIGGYPGLLIANYLLRGCRVVAIDSPFYRPEEYLRFSEARFFHTIEHDINAGPPPLNSEAHFDFCVMSDVLLHNEGFPSEFIRWAIEHCDRFYMINYNNGQGRVRHGPTAHSLHSGYELPTAQSIIDEMQKLGAELVERRSLTKSDRDLLIFKKTEESGDLGRAGVLPLQTGRDGNTLRSQVESEPNSDAGGVDSVGSDTP